MPNEPKPRERWLWTPAWVAGVASSLALARAFSWQWVNQHSDVLRLTPRGERWMVVAALAAPLFPAMAVLWAAMTQRLKTRLVLVLLGLVVLSVAGGVATLMVMPPLFEGRYVLSNTSPDGAREGHVHENGLLGCSGTLFVSEKGALWGERVEQKSLECDSYEVVWSSDGGVSLTGKPPAPSGLYFGPH